MTSTSVLRARARWAMAPIRRTVHPTKGISRAAEQPLRLAPACTLSHMAAPLPHPRRVFAERLAARPILFDGAMGTLLFSRGIPQRASLDELVDTHPDL